MQEKEKEKKKCYIVGPAESNNFFIRRSNGVKKKET